MRIAVCTSFLCALLTALAISQPSGSPGEASVHGTVSDSQHHPVEGAVVYLQASDGAQIRKTRTDSSGAYRFSGLAEGAYAVRADAAKEGQASSTVGPLHARETKTIDLTLSTSSLAFFDEPTFSVAGVTDTTNLGGHGSDTVMRTKDALAKATVSLSEVASGNDTTNLAANEETLRASLWNDPGNFVANLRLGKLLVENGRIGAAKPYLAKASEVESGNSSVSAKEKAELHHLLGDIAEKSADPLAAVREYQRAAEFEASEANIFDWGAELLLHRAPEPSAEVFGNGNRLFPHSIRMLLGLGVAWYVRGFLEEATKRLCEAADLEPRDPTPYLFLGKIQGAESSVPAIAQRLQRFATVDPQNAMANYYYAVSLWKQRQGPDDVETSARAQSLLEKAVALDPKLGEAFLQLGIVYSERKDFGKAIAAFQQALHANPRMEQAHYRLAQAYRSSGQNDLAKNEIRLYEQISREKTAEHERERADIKQFVYTLKGKNP